MERWLILLVVAPFIFGSFGAVVERVVLGGVPGMPVGGWRKWYYVTIPWDYLIAGAITGAVGHGMGIPVPEAFGTELAGSMIAYAFSGGVAIVGYDTIVKVLKRFIEAIRLP